jgi:hypothetical protein
VEFETIGAALGAPDVPGTEEPASVALSSKFWTSRGEGGHGQAEQPARHNIGPNRRLRFISVSDHYHRRLRRARLGLDQPTRQSPLPGKVSHDPPEVPFRNLRGRGAGRRMPQQGEELRL